MVTPAALRASGIGAINTHAVSLPSMTRSTRSHVVIGIRRNPTRGTSATSRTTAVQTPDCRTRLSALSARSIVRSSIVPGPSTARAPGSHAGSTAAAVLDSACPRTQSNRDNSMTARDCRCRIETIKGIDERDGFAAAGRGGEPGDASWCGRTRPRRRFPKDDRAATRQADGRRAQEDQRRRWRLRLGQRGARS